MDTTTAVASLDLVTAQALFEALPRHLQNLSVSVGITDYDRMASWAAALSSLPPGLSSLRLLGPLCHVPDLAEAMAGWAMKLPCLRRLELALAECCHSHPDLRAQLYDDPENWTSSSWHGVFPALTQLRALQLFMEKVGDGFWCDLRSCSHLTCLRLLPTSWSGMCEAVGICALTGLRELALTVSEPSELEELSTLSQLTRLDLEMVGITIDESGETCGSPASANRRRGLVHKVTRGLARLRRFKFFCRSATIDAEELGLLSENCPELTSLRIHAPFKRISPLACRPHTVSLPPHLRVLQLENARMTSCTSSMPGGILRLAMLPMELVVLTLEGLGFELLSAQHDGMDASVTFGPEERGPSTSVVRMVRCTLGCALAQVCGKELHSLELISTCLLVDAPGSRGAGSGGLASLRCGCQLRRLRVWGCKGNLRPLNDEAMHKLVNKHPHLVDLALNASFATRSGLSALAKLKQLRRLKIAVVSQECAAALGPGSTSLQRLTELEVVLPALNFVGDCVRAYLAATLPNVQVRLRAQQAGDEGTLGV
ncbi:hypothetical protein VaNZ11_009099 [Volvox africanus]|uniref:Uncharacterized protein n=1 Tax=Volvox africanus TaxID=51714 RepID=A0ABQ5S8M0_9CHLO|nr:hypothetical protein VaNZ11_009099 [Volvox africanus]